MMAVKKGRFSCAVPSGSSTGPVGVGDADGDGEDVVTAGAGPGVGEHALNIIALIAIAHDAASRAGVETERCTRRV